MVVMPGASEQTRRVKALNANWSPGGEGGDGRFEIIIVTDDDEQHTVAVSLASMTALVALSQADGVLMLWDPADHTMIVANANCSTNEVQTPLSTAALNRRTCS
jgi:hypothetical protein